MGESYPSDLVLINPSTSEALGAIEQALSRRLFLIVAGRCHVTYEGRARSKLPSGERVLIVKEDGSLLVHRKRDYSPVNWQPPGSLFYPSLEKQVLRLRALRRQPQESIEVAFSQVRLVCGMALRDEAEFTLHADEAEMKQAVILRPSLIQDGFRPTDSEKPLESGFVDLYGVDAHGVQVVVEFKKDAADKAAVIQLSRYVNELRVRLPHRQFMGVLAAPSLKKSASRMLKSLSFHFVALDPKMCARIIEESRPPETLTQFLDKETLIPQHP